jgi:hypothetical protein
MNEYWRNSFHSGLAWASDGCYIVAPEKGHLSEAGQSSRHGQLACASIGDLPCGSWVIASRHACRIPGEASSRLAGASDGGEASWLAKLLPYQLACASDDEAGWPNER